jgi:hypothetical protein
MPEVERHPRQSIGGLSGVALFLSLLLRLQPKISNSWRQSFPAIPSLQLKAQLFGLSLNCLDRTRASSRSITWLSSRTRCTLSTTATTSRRPPSRTRHEHLARRLASETPGPRENGDHEVFLEDGLTLQAFF